MEYRDEGRLIDWLRAVDGALEGPLMDATDDELLYFAGQVDRLLVGDPAQLRPDAWEALVDQLTAVRVVSGTEAHLRGFEALNVKGHMNPDEHAVAVRVQAALASELRVRMERRARPA